MTHPLYKGRRVALLTRHGKETVVRRQLAEPLGAVLVHTEAYDTDRLGTFSRTVPRSLSPIDAARRKARLAMELTGSPVGMGSEGSFGAGPFGDLLPWNQELLIWLDPSQELEVIGRAAGPAHHEHLQTDNWPALAAFARSQGFPAQRLVLRPEHRDHAAPTAGVGDWPTLRRAFGRCLRHSNTGRVFVETDLRACYSPPRMRRIGEAAADLLRRLSCFCRACQSPGYGISGHEKGLPCRQCRLPTRQTAAAIWSCPRCGFSERDASGYSEADPQFCETCNP